MYWRVNTEALLQRIVENPTLGKLIFPNDELITVPLTAAQVILT